MQTLLPLILVTLISTLALAQDKNAIAPSINVVTTERLDNLGLFRIISHNSEIEACFYVQEIQLYPSEKIINTTPICAVELNGEIFNIKTSGDGNAYFKDFNWFNTGITFILDKINSQYTCTLSLKQRPLIKPICARP